MKLFDLETNGLLDTATKIHCLVIKDRTTGMLGRYIPSGFPMQAEGTIEQGLEILSKGPIGGHNIIKYDIPVIEKLYPQWTYDKHQVFDTLTAVRVIWANIKDRDTGLLKKKQLPGLMFGSHSLEAWGYRLKLMKGEYKSEYIARAGDSYQPGDEWLNLSPEMLDYCVQDVIVTDALYEKILGKEYSEAALLLEHQVAWLMAQQERNGFPFDKQKAALLYALLAQRRGELERELKEYFRYWFAPEGAVRNPTTRKVWHGDPMGGDTRNYGTKKAPRIERGWYEHFTEGCAYTKVKIVEFNPSSRDHIADRLQKLYGWVPEVFTDGGKPQVDEDTVGHLDYPPMPLIIEYLMVAKRISQLAEGKQAWLKLEKNGKIHGSINPNGAVTGRATHSRPNVSQVPASTSLFGPECRELWTVPKGWLLVGADASGLELRCLAHFMARYDGGKYAEVLLNGDIHWVNVIALGLFPDGTVRDKHNPKHEAARAIAKTFIYAFLYGAGDAKIGSIVGGGMQAGKKLKATFLRKLPALDRLIKAVKEASKRGHLIGLDGRLLHVRSSHAALNVLLQSAGALVCKQWLVMLEEDLQRKGLKHGWNGGYCFVAWSHDECQIATKSQEVAEVVCTAAEECVVKAGEHFNFRCPLAGESKVGTNWSQTH